MIFHAAELVFFRWMGLISCFRRMSTFTSNGKRTAAGAGSPPRITKISVTAAEGKGWGDFRSNFHTTTHVH